MRKADKILVGMLLKGRDSLGDLGVEGKIIFK
jgi:hypothetical protein